MITISSAKKSEIKKFDHEEWIEPDIKYYGEARRWPRKKYIFKAVEDEIIVGIILGSVNSGIFYVEDLIVAKNKRKSGIGKMLMKQAEDFAKKLGAHKAWLLTGKNWGVKGFYEKLGYIATGEMLNHYKHADFVIYEKPLK